ncbi:MAG: hypothetical protein IPG01_00165 [Chitinophagaceae bacterium]|nr:hypothetical protein [Chitinophagaceae bacterium]
MNLQELLSYMEGKRRWVIALTFNERKDIDRLVEKTEQAISELEIFQHINPDIKTNFKVHIKNFRQDIAVASKLDRRHTTGKSTEYHFKETKKEVLTDLHNIITELTQRVESIKKKGQI